MFNKHLQVFSESFHLKTEFNILVFNAVMSFVNQRHNPATPLAALFVNVATVYIETGLLRNFENNFSDFFKTFS